MVNPIKGVIKYTANWSQHTNKPRGVDIRTFDNPFQPCYAVTDGVVIQATDNNGAKFIQLRTKANSKISYFYVHLSRFEGDSRSVKEGDIIGYCGNSGNVGYHLHFGKMVNGVYVNPESDINMSGKYTYEELEAIVTKYEKKINDDAKTIEKYEKALNEKDATIEKYEKHINEHTLIEENLRIKLSEAQEGREKAEVALSTSQGQIETLNVKIEELNASLILSNNSNLILKDTIKRQKDEITELKANNPDNYQQIIGPLYLQIKDGNKPS